MVVDKYGYRANVGIVLVSKQGHLFLGRRIGHNAWQFPQGGVDENETARDAMFRELTEELGLTADDVTLLGVTKRWIKYRLPRQFVRRNVKPLVIGQKQKWFLLELKTSEQKIRLDYTAYPEFDSWRWVDYWYPPRVVIYFKRAAYQRVLKELEPYLRACSKTRG